MQITSKGKTLNLEPLKNVIRQGENNADEVVFELPKFRENVDLTALQWTIRATSEKDTLATAQLEKNFMGDSLLLIWPVTSNFTAEDGNLEISLTGIDSNGNTVVKFDGDTPIFIKAAPNGTYTPTPDALEAAMQQIQRAISALNNAGQALEATGMNFRILGFYDTLSELQSGVTNPAIGDAYGVGSNPIIIYLWTGTEWGQGPQLTISLEDYINTSDIGTTIAGIDSNGDITPMPSANDVGAYSKNETDTLLITKAGIVDGKISPMPNIADVGGSNRNLLDNWYFENPVNQRGKTSYTGTGPIMSIDRWKLSGSESASQTCSITSEGVQLGSGTGFVQTWERRFSENLNGKTVTLSVIVNGELRSCSFVWDKDTGYTTLEQYPDNFRVAYRGESNYVHFFNFNSTETVILIAAKLELGSASTLAHQDESGGWVLNDPPPDYGAELTKCQRYQLALISDQLRVTTVGANTLFFFIPTPVTMRAVPSISMNNLVVKAINGATAIDGFTFAVTSIRSNGIMISATKSSHGLTDAFINAGNTSNPTLLDANL